MNRDKKNKLMSSEFMKAKTKIITLTLVTCLLLVLVSFGYFYAGSNQSDRNRLTGGCFNTSFTDQNSINLTNAMPESFDDAKKDDPYEFTLTNSCTLPVKYYVLLNVKSGSFDPSFIDFSMNESNYDNLSNVLENTNRFSIDEGYNKSYIIGSGLINSGSETKQLRLWIDEAVNTSDFESNTGFTAQVKVVGEVASQIGTDKIMNLAAGSPTNSTDVIDKGTIGEGTSACTNTLAYDGTADNNLRYVGANPCNYVSFNNEVWRIIGVMNNVDDGTGKLETRLKIIRNNRLGRYSFDSSVSSINSGWGNNDWVNSELMRELNGDYLNVRLSEDTMWYNGKNNQKTAVYSPANGLKNAAQNLISNAIWNLGARSNTSNNENNPSNAYSFYTEERGNAVPVAGRQTFWIGKVALIYPSDYGFATSGGNNISRNDCINANISIGDNSWESSYSTCRLQNWIYSISPNSYFWLLTPDKRKVYIQSLLITSNTDGYVSSYNGNYGPYNTNVVYPTVYLKSNVSIISGDGSLSNMFQLG